MSLFHRWGNWSSELNWLVQGYESITELMFCWLCLPSQPGVPGWLSGKSLPLPAEMQEAQIRSLGREDPLEQGMAAHFSTLAWRSPCMEESGGLQFMGLQSQTWLSDWVYTPIPHTPPWSWSPPPFSSYMLLPFLFVPCWCALNFSVFR